MKAVLFGFLAVGVMLGLACSVIAILRVWIEWAMSINNPFWSVALGPAGALLLFIAVFIFAVGASFAGREGR